MEEEKVLKKLKEIGKSLEDMTILEAFHVLVPVTVGYLKAVKDQYNVDMTVPYLQLFLNTCMSEDKKSEETSGSETETVGQLP